MTTDGERNAAPNDGGPAFPGPDGGGQVVTSNLGHSYAVPNMNPGMSLRDYLAGQVIAGALVDRPPEYLCYPANSETFARAAYGLADAMLAVRQEGRCG